MVEGDSTVKISVFDHSIENHFKAMDTISKLCGEDNDSGTVSLDDTDIKRFSSSITFLREWRWYNYGEKVIRFASEKECPQPEANFCSISLPQFSSTTVPSAHQEGEPGARTAKKCSQDFAMYVGGSVWALDWCPRIHERPNSPFKLEFVAIAAHPPESYYHKIGVPLTGRGAVQIWCVLNVNGNEEAAHPLRKPRKSKQSALIDGKEGVPKRPKGRPRKKKEEPDADDATKESPTQIKRPRGRPRKKQTEESCDDEAMVLIQFKRKKERPRKKKMNEPFAGTDNVNEHVVPLAIEYPEGLTELPAIEEAFPITQEQPKSIRKGKKRRSSFQELPTCNLSATMTKQSKRSRSKAKVQTDPSLATCSPLLFQNEEGGSSDVNPKMHEDSRSFCVANDCSTADVSADMNSVSWSIPEDIALPRLVLCLAHNGRVAWDAKWRPFASDLKCQYRMGYLAVVLGNGALEVWDVPLPLTMKCIYSSSHEEGTDPRFIKIEPVFRCSQLNCGERQSIPWTVEWSTSYPHDYLLAGCHDGTVALWRFSASGLSEDTRPLLCFSADTVPIRAVAWAPVGSDQEDVNVIVTAGHSGLKFWDIRDPFHPLWDLHPAPKFIYALDWAPDPRCLVLTLDDGTLRLLSLSKAAYDAPVNGKPTVGPKQLGISLLNSSSFAFWSVQISRITGMVAYCGADGTVFRFQLTTKAVDKETSRNRAPHFKCGFLSKDESAIIVNTPLPDVPLTWKKPVNVGDNPRSMRSLLSMSNQAKTTKDQKALASGSQLLAISYGDESDNASGSPTSKSKKNSISKCSNQNEGEDAQALICREEDQDDTLEKPSKNGGAVSEVEHFPSKAVAIHRVRWNMNKGSERWLCYGGAAGIVRCQEIVMSDTDKYLASKR